MLWCDSVAPLGKPVVPLVYWTLIASSADSEPGALAQLVLAHLVGAGQQLLPVAGLGEDHALEGVEPVADLAHHRPVVRGLVPGGRHQQPAARLAQRVLQLAGAVGGVDVHQHHAGLGAGVLDQHPLDAVGRPDAHPVAGLQARGHERPRQPVDLGVQLAVGHPHVLVAHHERVRVGIRARRCARGSPRWSRRGGESRTLRASTRASCGASYGRMLEGLMQHDHPLTVQHILERVRGFHADAEVATLTDGRHRAGHVRRGRRPGRPAVRRAEVARRRARRPGGHVRLELPAPPRGLPGHPHAWARCCTR